MIDKDTFFKAIDTGRHLNAKTREDYWAHFKEKCNHNLELLSTEKGAPYSPDTGIHLYIKFSLEKYFSKTEEGGNSGTRKAGKADHPGDSKISPIDTDWKKESATTWGTNNDVKYK
jgi:hypothetical protein